MKKIILKITIFILIQGLLLCNNLVQAEVLEKNNLSPVVNVHSVDFQHNFQTIMDLKVRVAVQEQDLIAKYIVKKVKKQALAKIKKAAIAAEKKAQASDDLHDWLDVACMNFAIGPKKYDKVIRILGKLEDDPIFKPAANFIGARIAVEQKKADQIQYFATEALVGSMENDDDVLAMFSGALLSGLLLSQVNQKTALVIPMITHYLKTVEEYVQLPNPNEDQKHNFQVALVTLQAFTCIFYGRKQFKQAVYLGDKLFPIIDNKALDINNKVKKKMISNMCFWLGASYENLTEYEKAEYLFIKAFKLNPEDFDNANLLIKLTKKVRSPKMYKRILVLINDTLTNEESIYKYVLNEMLLQDMQGIAPDELRRNREKIVSLGEKEKFIKEFYPYLINFAAITGRVQLARKYYEDAKELLENELDLKLSEAIVCFYEGKSATAEQLLTGIFESINIHKLTQVYKEYQVEITGFIVQMFQNNDLPVNIRINIGKFLSEIDPKLIQTIYDQALERIRDNIKKSDYEEAEKQLFRQLQINPQDEELLSFKKIISTNLELLKNAEEALENNNWAQALICYEKYLELNPQEDPADYGIAELRGLKESSDVKQHFVSQVNALMDLAKRQEKKAKFNSAYKNYNKVKELVTAGGSMFMDAAALQRVRVEIKTGLDQNQGKSDRIVVHLKREADKNKATTAPVQTLKIDIKSKHPKQKKKVLLSQNAKDFFDNVDLSDKLALNEKLNYLGWGQIKGKPLNMEEYFGKFKSAKKVQFFSLRVKQYLRVIYVNINKRILIIGIGLRKDVYDKLNNSSISNYEDIEQMLKQTVLFEYDQDLINMASSIVFQNEIKFIEQAI